MRPRHEYEEALRWVEWGLNDCAISRLTDIPRGTIRDWRTASLKGEGAAPYRNGGGCPLCTSEALNEVAYAYLLGLYLGDGCLSLHRRGVYRLRIVLDQRYPQIITECAQAMAAVRRGRTQPHLQQRTGCIEVSAYWKHWVCLFPQHGPGVKHRRRIELRAWQREVVQGHPSLFLRGLIHSDGWRGINRVNVRGRSYEYPRYQFTNHSKDIQKLFCWACDLYGVEWKQMTWKAISIARAADVQRLDEVIGLKR